MKGLDRRGPRHQETTWPRYLLLKHYRGGPEPDRPYPPMDQWPPEDPRVLAWSGGARTSMPPRTRCRRRCWRRCWRRCGCGPSTRRATRARGWRRSRRGGSSTPAAARPRRPHRRPGAQGPRRRARPRGRGRPCPRSRRHSTGRGDRTDYAASSPVIPMTSRTAPTLPVRPASTSCPKPSSRSQPVASHRSVRSPERQRITMIATSGPTNNTL